MDVSNELDKNQTLLVIVPSIDYNAVAIDVAKKLSKKPVCYVSLNKSADSLKELFKKNNVNVGNIVFIDAITKTFKDVPDQTDGVYFVQSPAALTEISITINKVLKHGFEYLIFDSLTNLLIYTEKAPVAKFVLNVANHVKENKTKAVFYALDIKKHEALIQEACMFVDKAIDLSSKGKDAHS